MANTNADNTQNTWCVAVSVVADMQRVTATSFTGSPQGQAQILSPVNKHAWCKTERHRCVPRAAVDIVAGDGALHPRTGLLL